MDRKTLKKKINAAFAELKGKSADIAAALHRRKIKGSRYHGATDPIANLIRKRLPNMKHVFNHVSQVRFTDGDGNIWTANTPKRIQQFIADFDLGRYPKLVGRMPARAFKKRTK